jgi:hypothetical protein
MVLGDFSTACPPTRICHSAPLFEERTAIAVLHHKSGSSFRIHGSCDPVADVASEPLLVFARPQHHALGETIENQYSVRDSPRSWSVAHGQHMGLVQQTMWSYEPVSLQLRKRVILSISQRRTNAHVDHVGLPSTALVFWFVSDLPVVSPPPVELLEVGECGRWAFSISVGVL